jgi:hypothetical protein
MLRAMKQQLITLSEQEGPAFRAKLRLYTEARALGAHPFESTALQLQQFIIHLPEMVSQIVHWYGQDGGTMSALRQLHGFTLTTLYQPADYLDHADDGFFGYLDDAYLVGSVVAKTLCLQTLQLQDGARALNAKLPQWLDLCRQTIPATTGQIDDLLERILFGNSLPISAILEELNQGPDLISRTA